MTPATPNRERFVSAFSIVRTFRVIADPNKHQQGTIRVSVLSAFALGIGISMALVPAAVIVDLRKLQHGTFRVIADPNENQQGVFRVSVRAWH